MTSRFARLLSVFGASGLVVLALPTIAHAENNNRITACVSKAGRVRIVSAAREAGRHDSVCRRGERVITWNVTGSQGPPGPPGPQGPPGNQGPPGPGFSGIQYYTVGNGDLRPVGGGNFGTSFAPPPGGTFSTAAAPLLAGVHLPQSAQVLAIRAHVFDNSTSDVTIELIEQALPDGNALLVSSVASTGAAGTPYSIDAAPAMPHLVDNAQFHYFVRVLPAPGWTATTLQVLGVTIAYTLLPIPGS
jgi:hypothetical protein